MTKGMKTEKQEQLFPPKPDYEGFCKEHEVMVLSGKTVDDIVLKRLSEMYNTPIPTKLELIEWTKKHGCRRGEQ